jgi:hypothetical protein
MKYTSLVVAILLLVTGCGSNSGSESTEITNQTTSEWIDLMAADHWKQYNTDAFPDRGWSFVDGELLFQPGDSEDWTSGLDIITREEFQDFELEMEWTVSQGGNSGIFYFAIEQPQKAIYWSGLEMQILDNENHPDSDQGVDGNRKAGSLYDLIPANPQNAHPFDQWNAIKIVSKGSVIEHWMNGEKVLEYDRSTETWEAMLFNSKFRDHPEFGAAVQGHIGLQDHGDPLKFRNIRIRRL